ncbi:hypothetical protein Y1Q_0006571 [Alligator mississippiensis]|uniref:Uncharacterized protein n=1 Tax=Alligator mississippiensis TaxID=8496 RepID=A0A151NT43_ALLMI|nr:hypothetical protein Y1Q_0006571 [Alligator mississippiensis]
MWMYMHMATRNKSELLLLDVPEALGLFFPDILHFCSSGNDDEKCKCNVFKADGKTSGLNKGTYRHRSLLPMTVFHGMTSGKLPHHVYKSSIIK